MYLGREDFAVVFGLSPISETVEGSSLGDRPLQVVNLFKKFPNVSETPFDIQISTSPWISLQLETLLSMLSSLQMMSASSNRDNSPSPPRLFPRLEPCLEPRSTPFARQSLCSGKLAVHSGRCC